MNQPRLEAAAGAGLLRRHGQRHEAEPAFFLARRGPADEFETLAKFFARENSGYELGHALLSGEAAWRAETAVEHYWLESGQAQVRLHVPLREHSEQKTEAQVWETLEPGDLLVLSAECSAELRGHARFWCIRCAAVAASPWAGLRKLAHLEDKAGGCNTGLGAFRRLQVTWCSAGISPEHPDGKNLLGSHVVYIAQATSRTHYHPVPLQGGGRRQHELYLVLDPAAHGLPAHSPAAGVWIYPEPGDWNRFEFVPLAPGDVFSIRAGVAHRAKDILACVIAVPGFKPGNDVYVDAEIARETRGQAPHCAAYAGV